MSVFLENDGKSKENDELCRTKIAGIAEKNGKTSCDEEKYGKISTVKRTTGKHHSVRHLFIVWRKVTMDKTSLL